MTVAKVIEITASSPKSVEDAVRSGLKKVSETVKGIQGAWVNETKVVTNGSGEITEWRVNLRVTFLWNSRAQRTACTCRWPSRTTTWSASVGSVRSACRLTRS